MKKKIFICVAAVVMSMFFAALSLTGCDNPWLGAKPGSGGGGGGAGVYAVGETGPGGGIIFYYSEAGFTVTGLGTCHYLEAAPNNQATVTWSSGSFDNFVDVTGAAGTAIGTGKANTAAIVAALPGDTAANNAAKAAVAYTGGGKSDWFLPSIDELNAMYEAKIHLGITSGTFWSSSQSEDSGGAQTQNFGDGSQTNIGKDFVGGRNVRAIRAF